MTAKKPRRCLCLILAWLLAFQLLPPAALAEEAAINVTVATGSKEKSLAEIPVQWDTAWFTADTSEYRQELALTALALSGAAYAQKGGSLCVQDALKALGFGKIKSYHYGVSSDIGDRTAYTFAVQKLKSAEGTPQYLIAVVVRGTGEYMEWASNLRMGAGSEHMGFVRAEKELLANLKSYLTEIDGSLKFLITGHSRGGAVANLLAARLPEAGLAKGEDIYAYTFAAPTVSAEVPEEGYGWIFNIVNEEDLVTRVPLPAWGYRRYGIDLPLPVEHKGELFDAMNQQYKALTDQDYAVYQDPNATDRLAEAIYRLAPTPTGTNMEMLAALFSGDLDGLSTLIEHNGIAALLLGRTALEVSSQLVPLIRQEQAGMRSAHCVAGYYSWLSVTSSFPEANR